VLQIS